MFKVDTTNRHSTTAGHSFTMTIGGEAIAAAATYTVINPANGQVIASAPDCSRDELDQAVTANRAFGSVPSMLPDYDASIGETVRQFAAYWGNEPGDPEKIAQVVVRVAEADRLPPHILLGSDAIQGALGADAARNAAAERWRAVSTWTDVASKGPLPDFPSE